MKNMVFLKILKVDCKIQVKSMFSPKRSQLEDPYAILFGLPAWPDVSSGIHFDPNCSRGAGRNFHFFSIFFWSPTCPKIVPPGPGGPWGPFSNHFQAILGPWGPRGEKFFSGPGPYFFLLKSPLLGAPPVQFCRGTSFLHSERRNSSRVERGTDSSQWS